MYGFQNVVRGFAGWPLMAAALMAFNLTGCDESLLSGINRTIQQEQEEAEKEGGKAVGFSNAEGTTVRVADPNSPLFGAEIRIPPNALAPQVVSAVATIRTSQQATDGDVFPVGPIVEFRIISIEPEAEPGQFLQPVTAVEVVLPFNPDRITATTDVFLAHYNPALPGWELLDNVTTTSKTIAGPTLSLSPFAAVVTDEAKRKSELCIDVDGDGYGAGCTAGPDCDDGDPDTYRQVVAYADRDGDGKTVGSSAQFCVGEALPADLSLTSTEIADCNDKNADIFEEVIAWTDFDGDGAGQYPVLICAGFDALPDGYAQNGDDCDDNDPDNISSCQTCTDKDGDGNFIGCDRYVDRAGPDCNDGNPDLFQQYTAYRDGDDDGHKVGNVQQVCGGASLPTGYLVNPPDGADDCNDANGSVYRTANTYRDADGDTVTKGGAVEQCIGDGAPAGYRLTRSATDDCNDADAGLATTMVGFADADLDTFTAGGAVDLCTDGSLPEGYRSSASGTPDCDDNDASINPNATDLPGDGIDQNCDGVDPQPDDTTGYYVSVSVGNDAWPGTMTEPVATVTQAVSLAEADGNKPVFLAAGDYHLADPIETSVSLYGGYATNFTAHAPASYVTSLYQQQPNKGVLVVDPGAAVTVTGVILDVAYSGGWVTMETVAVYGTLSLRSSTVYGASVSAAASRAIANYSPTTLSLYDSAVYAGNGEYDSTGIYNNGSATIVNSVVEGGWSGSGNAYGIDNDGAGSSLVVRGGYIQGGDETDAAYGVYNRGGSVAVKEDAEIVGCDECGTGVAIFTDDDGGTRGSLTVADSYILGVENNGSEGVGIHIGMSDADVQNSVIMAGFGVGGSGRGIFVEREGVADLLDNAGIYGAYGSFMSYGVFNYGGQVAMSGNSNVVGGSGNFMATGVMSGFRDLTIEDNEIHGGSAVFSNGVVNRGYGFSGYGPDSVDDGYALTAINNEVNGGYSPYAYGVRNFGPNRLTLQNNEIVGLGPLGGYYGGGGQTVLNGKAAGDGGSRAFGVYGGYGLGVSNFYGYMESDNNMIAGSTYGGFGVGVQGFGHYGSMVYGYGIGDVQSNNDQVFGGYGWMGDGERMVGMRTMFNRTDVQNGEVFGSYGYNDSYDAIGIENFVSRLGIADSTVRGTAKYDMAQYATGLEIDDSKLTLERSDVTGGYGWSSVYGIDIDDSNGTVNDSTVEGGFSDSNRSVGIDSYYSNLTIATSDVVGGYGYGNQIGIRHRYNGNLDVDRSDVRAGSSLDPGNCCSDYGYGVFVKNSGATANLSNNFIRGGEPAYEVAGVVQSNSDTVVASNNTIYAGDFDDRGYAYMFRSTDSGGGQKAILTNNILDGGYGMYGDDDNASVYTYIDSDSNETMRLTNNLLWGATTRWLVAEGYNGTLVDSIINVNLCSFTGCGAAQGNISADHKLANIGTGAIKLPAGSPAIDAGIDPALIAYPVQEDKQGDVRPVGPAHDIGADERK